MANGAGLPCGSDVRESIGGDASLLLLVLLVLATGVVIWWVVRRRRLAPYTHALQEALADGELSEEESKSLEQLAAECRLSEDERKRAAQLAVRERFVRITDGLHRFARPAFDDWLALGRELGLTEGEALAAVAPHARELIRNMYRHIYVHGETDPGWRATIEEALQALGLDPAEFRKEQDLMRRFLFLTEVRAGRLPDVPAPIILQPGEVCHWVTLCRLLEERVVRREYVGGSRGVSIRLAKGLYYRVGGHRGRVVSERAIVPVDEGELVVTSRRVVFNGRIRTLSVPYGKLVDVHAYRDAVVLARAGKKKPEALAVDDPELVATIIRVAATRAPARAER
ncbi:MAG: hypothetical protein ACUVTQ_11235 [Desulfotomaculales bacterium]